MSTHDKDSNQGTDLSLDDAEHHNDQQNRREEPKIDDGLDMSIDAASPDSLAAPKRGKGVRRLSHLPLVIVGGVVALAVMDVTYTMYDRQQQQQTATNGAGEIHTVGIVAESPVQPGPTSAPPAPPGMPTGAGWSGVGQQARDSVPVKRGDQPQNTDSTPPQVSWAVQSRLQKIKQAEDLRFQLAMQPLDSGSPTEMGCQTDRNMNTNGAAVPGMMPVSGQGRASADELMDRYMAANGLVSGGMGAGGPEFAGGGMGGMGGGGNSMAAENQQGRK